MVISGVFYHLVGNIQWQSSNNSDGKTEVLLDSDCLHSPSTRACFFSGTECFYENDNFFHNICRHVK